MDENELTATQQAALAQLQDITDGGDPQVAINVLESVNWDVQRAANAIFETSGPEASSTREEFEIDDSLQGIPERASPESPLALITRPLFTILTFPFSLLSSIVRFVFTILRIPIPSIRFSGLTFLRTYPSPPSSSNSRPLDPRFQADRWIRALEEETGAISMNRAKTTGTVEVSGADIAGPSNLRQRDTTGRGAQDGQKVLPEFFVGSYEEALRVCQTQARIGCVVLVSEEHDDVAEFKRATLTDSTFVNVLHDNDFVVWGGDIRDSEAWSASQKLQTTTYPSVAFVALQPHRGPSSSTSSSSSPVLTVLSRHQGATATSAEALTAHLTQHLLPRVTPFLQRVQGEQRRKAQDRRLREEQDRAFQDAARIDRERIQARMDAERRAEEAAREEAARERREAEARERLARERKEREAARLAWRRWARRAERETRRDEGPIRIAFKLPSGQRSVASFPAETSLTTLYAHVSALLLPADLSPAQDPVSPPPGVPADLEAGVVRQVQAWGGTEEWWGFKLALAYPRLEIVWRPGGSVADVKGLERGGQVVVEMVNGHGLNGNGAGLTRGSGDEDGYDTEESDE